MTITLTREEAQQVLEHLDDLVDAQQWEIDMHSMQYGEGYKPQRMKHMKEQLANTNKTIETLRARLSAPEPEPKVEPKQSTTVAEREKVAKWMVKHGYATGHGDTIEDLLAQLDWQIKEKIND